jgi:hypothetical protein
MLIIARGKTPGTMKSFEIVREPELKRVRNHLSDETEKMHFENVIHKFKILRP